MRRALPWVISALAVLGCLGAFAEQTAKTSIMPGTPYETACYIKAGEKSGGTLFIIGGCHGDEKAGYLAARRLKSWRITAGTLFLITDAHVAAIKRNLRAYPDNMNNMFPGDPNGDSMRQLAFNIWSLIEQHRPQMLVTLHESMGFHRLEPERYGQTLTYDSHKLDDIFRPITVEVNRQIPDRDHHFSLFVKPFPSCPTYNAYFTLGIPATSVETCRQMELDERIQHQLLMCRAFMHTCDLEWDEKPEVDGQSSSVSRPDAGPSAVPADQSPTEEASGSIPPPAGPAVVSQRTPASHPVAGSQEHPVPPIEPPDASRGLNVIAIFLVSAGAGFITYALTVLALKKR